MTLIVHNVETGEITEKEFTAAQIKEREKIAAEGNALILAQMERQNARQSALAKLAALGLTEEEIAAL